MTITDPEQRVRNVINLEDVSAQRVISDRLTAMRREHLDAREYANLLGVPMNNLYLFEHRNRENMSVQVVERRAAPLGLRLVLDLEGLPDEVEEDLDVVILSSMRPAAMADRANVTALLAASRLQIGRVLLGVTERELAARMGVASSTVGCLMRDACGKTRIASFQRIARSLGGRALPHLVALDGE